MEGQALLLCRKLDDPLGPGVFWAPSNANSHSGAVFSAETLEFGNSRLLSLLFHKLTLSLPVNTEICNAMRVYGAKDLIV